MKPPLPASLVLIVSLLLLAGCDSVRVPDVFATDQVPTDVKEQPRLVTVPPPLTGNEPLPRVGDVPYKPRDFSPKPVYDHYISELELDRAESEKAGADMQADAPTQPQYNSSAPFQAPKE